MSKPAPRRGGAALPHEVRLIGGVWRKSKLPVADRPGLRPTPDRVRETLFNWLGQDLAGWRVLDAYAGSGALGFEAASRGAAEVVLVESDAALVAALEAVRQRLKADSVRVMRADAQAWMASALPRSLDLVFVDPPYSQRRQAEAAGLAAALVVAGGYVYVEGPQPLPQPPVGLEPYRSLVAGAVHAQLFRRPV